MGKSRKKRKIYLMVNHCECLPSEAKCSRECDGCFYNPITGETVHGIHNSVDCKNSEYTINWVALFVYLVLLVSSISVLIYSNKL